MVSSPLARALAALLAVFTGACGAPPAEPVAAPAAGPGESVEAPERPAESGADVGSDDVGSDDVGPEPGGEPLAWSTEVGFEPRHRFAPGEVSYRRPEGSWLVLEYVLGPHFEGIAGRSAGRPLDDKPLIVRDAAELCDPRLHAAVARLAPGRLLVHLQTDLDDAARDCLARLDVDLYLSGCRHDGALPLTDRCTDGDATLARIVASEVLRRRVRGLAIGFGEETSWAALLRFERLEQLVLGGTALEHVDVRAAFGLCAMSTLREVNVLNPNRPGGRLPLLPPGCALGWRSLEAWDLGGLGDQLLRAPDTPCALERLVAYRVTPAHRRAFEAACPDLRELGVMSPLEWCERASGDVPLRCRPL